MSDNNGWSGKPGVPLNPERDGAHWISLLGGKDNAQVIEWFADAMCWDETDWTTEDFGLHARYLGPCLTPAEVEARIATAHKDALEEAALVAENEPEPEGEPPPELHGRSVKNIATAAVRATKRSIAAAIRALKGEK